VDDAPVSSDKQINLKGQTCPITLVKAKLGIESIEVGQTLELWLDDSTATDSVSTALSAYGHEILRKEKRNETDWVVLALKKVSD
jgi:TusA-related sulfurtransferase